MRKNKSLYTMVVTGLLMAVGMVLPYITGQIQIISRIISPLHIPVLICGLCCGWRWGLALGVVLPVFRGLTLGFPPFPTNALPMAFELGAYGLFTGILYPLFLKLLKEKSRLPAMLLALISAMILGRLVGGAARGLLLSLGFISAGTPYTFSAFFTSYFVSTAPGALIHIVLIPVVVSVLEKAKLSPMVR